MSGAELFYISVCVPYWLATFGRDFCFDWAYSILRIATPDAGTQATSLARFMHPGPTHHRPSSLLRRP